MCAVIIREWQVRGQDNVHVSILGRMDWRWYQKLSKRMPEEGQALWRKMSLVLPRSGLRSLWTIQVETLKIQLYV